MHTFRRLLPAAVDSWSLRPPAQEGVPAGASTAFRRGRHVRPAAALVAVALLLVLTGCTGGHPEVERQIAAANVGAGAGFEPTTITVDKDDNVRLAVGNASTRVHGFSIEGYGIQREVEPNNGIEVRFPATKPGTFKIWCQLHETHQVATLIVQ